MEYKLKRNLFTMCLVGVLSINAAAWLKGNAESEEIIPEEPIKTTELVKAKKQITPIEEVVYEKPEINEIQKYRHYVEELLTTSPDGDAIYFNQTIEENGEKKYNSDDISVVSVFNPLTEKEECFLAVFSVYKNELCPKEKTLKIFKGTKLEELITNDKIEFYCTYTLYQSIFDSKTYNISIDIYSTSDGLNGMFDYYYCHYGSEISYNNYSSYVFNGTTDYLVEHDSYASANGTDFYNPERSHAYSVVSESLNDKLGINNTNLSISELQQILDDLNNTNFIAR